MGTVRGGPSLSGVLGDLVQIKTRAFKNRMSKSVGRPRSSRTIELKNANFFQTLR